LTKNRLLEKSENYQRPQVSIYILKLGLDLIFMVEEVMSSSWTG